MRSLFSAIFLLTAAAAGPAIAAGAPAAPLLEPKWTFDGMFGRFDQAQLQRGYKVFREVCASCHSLKYIAFRNLTEIGISEDAAKAFAAAVQVEIVDDEGQPSTRPGSLSDRFPSPFPNEQAAAAANGGSYPPDLSVMTKARAGGPDYVYSLLLGFRDEIPEGMTMPEGKNYNLYFPGHAIAMAKPLNDDQVEYEDGTGTKLPQLAADVSAFLHWAAEPRLDDRKELGIRAFLFILVMTALFYALKKQIWSRVH